jgi:hypothetical protein
MHILFNNNTWTSDNTEGHMIFKIFPLGYYPREMYVVSNWSMFTKRKSRGMVRNKWRDVIKYSMMSVYFLSGNTEEGQSTTSN